MPVILFAQVLCGIGSGLLTTLRTGTSTALWATYLVLTGLGLGVGSGVNVPHIAIDSSCYGNVSSLVPPNTSLELTQLDLFLVTTIFSSSTVR